MTQQPLGDVETLALALRHLADTIDARAVSGDAEASYTAQLLKKGPQKTAKKLIEEAGETGLAVVSEGGSAVANEAADLVYHLFVALRSRGVSLEAVAAALIKRQKMSGLEEKAARE